VPITIDEGEEATWLIDINDNQWMKDFYEKTLEKNLWNLWSLRFVIYTSKGNSFACKVDKSFGDEIKKIADSLQDKK